MANRNFTPRKPDNFIEGQDINKEESVSVESTNSEGNQGGMTDNSETPQDTNPVVTFSENAIQESNKAAPMVRVRTKIDHTCNIGGVRYHFVKGVQKNVPEEVKKILLRADLLMPL